MSWSEQLKWVFNIDTTCQGKVLIIACIKDKNVIDRILSHINKSPGIKSQSLINLPFNGYRSLYTNNHESHM